MNLVKQILYFSLTNITRKIANIDSSAQTATHFPWNHHKFFDMVIQMNAMELSVKLSSTDSYADIKIWLKNKR